MKILTSPMEMLEARIAPAALVNPTTVTFTDTDGDLVTVHASKGSFDLSSFAFSPSGLGEKLLLLSLFKQPEFTHADLTITAARSELGGDGLVNIGAISAEGLDLGKVRVEGDLTKITAGDANPATPAVKSLQVRSLGEISPDTSLLTGGLGALKIAGDMHGTLRADGSAARIGKVEIGGSLVGGDSAGMLVARGSIGSVTIGGDLSGGGLIAGTGRIESLEGAIGAVTIGGSITGAGPDDSGTIRAHERLGMLRVGGDILGGAGDYSGSVNAKSIGRAELHSLRGDAGMFSGSVLVSERIDFAGFTGSIIGGAGANSASFQVGDLGTLRVRGDVIGGASGRTGSIATPDFDRIEIGGSLIGGAGGAASTSGAIRIDDAPTGVIRIGGSIIGGGATSAGSIGGGEVASIQIGGSLIGGSSTWTGAVNLDGTAHVLRVGGDLIGGTGNASGYISTFGGQRLEIGGSLVASDAANAPSNATLLVGPVASLKIGGSLQGGAADESGALISNSVFGAISIGGSVASGDGQTSGAIRVGSLAKLRIGGSLEGSAGHPVLVTAENRQGFGSIQVGGSVSYARVLAGYNNAGTTLLGDGGAQADAQIGRVLVKGDWLASSLAAGTEEIAAGFANAKVLEGAMVTDLPELASRIGSIIIKGQVRGVAGDLASYGFSAEEIRSVRVGHASLPLQPGARNDLNAFPLGDTGDFGVREVPHL